MLSDIRNSFLTLKMLIVVYQMHKHANKLQETTLQSHTYFDVEQNSQPISWHIIFRCYFIRTQYSLCNPSNPACWSQVTREADYMLTVTNSFCLPNISINDSRNCLHIKRTWRLTSDTQGCLEYSEPNNIFFTENLYISRLVSKQSSCEMLCMQLECIHFKYTFHKNMGAQLGHCNCRCSGT